MTSPSTDRFLPHVSVDCVVFGVHAGELKLLLARWHPIAAWGLPGGYIAWEESADQAAERVLRERTGLDRVYLRQFHTFAGTTRGENSLRAVAHAFGPDMRFAEWMAERVVSIGYLALVDFAAAVPTPGRYADECRWWDVRDRPALLFDHAEMADRALETLRTQAAYLPLGRSLLPETFTMTELRRVYEAVLGRTLDRRNFEKRMLELGSVQRLLERRTGVAYRAPHLYRFVDGAAARGFDGRAV